MNFEIAFLSAIAMFIAIPAAFQWIVLDDKPIKLTHYPKMVLYANGFFVVAVAAFALMLTVCALVLLSVNHLMFDGPSVTTALRTLFWQL